jgi:hypothetical protein
MRIFYKTAIAASMMLVFSGCASHSNFVQKYNAWVGKNINTFIAQVGYPDRTYKLPNNRNTVYVYEESRIQSYPTITIGYGGFYGPMYGGMSYGSDIEQKTCKLFLEVTKAHKIVRWSSRGNNCVSSQPY